MAEVLKLVREVYIHYTSFGDALRFAWVGAVKALKTTPVVMVYRDGNNVKSEALTLSHKLGHMWGLTYSCGNIDCNSHPGDVSTILSAKKKNHSKVKFQCKACGWVTGWLSRPEWIVPVPHNEFYFTHSYPLTEEQEMYISKPSNWFANPKTNDFLEEGMKMDIDDAETLIFS
jgi:hypothetical protein